MRYEYKYFVPVEKLDQLRRMIDPFVRLDSYAAKQPDNQYTVRSIYFDSPSLHCFDEKVEGVGNRRKVRLRGYDLGNDESKVFMLVEKLFAQR